jgi:hypothetical protein
VAARRNQPAGLSPAPDRAGSQQRLVVHPIAVRKGRRLFEEGERPIPLRLLSSETFSTGVLHLVYGPAEPPGEATYEDAKVHLSQPEQ